MDVNVRLDFALKLSVIVMSSAILVGCGSVPRKPASSYSLQRFITPEVASEPLKVAGQAGYANMHKVILPTTQEGSPDFQCEGTLYCRVDESTFIRGDITVASGVAFNYNTQLNRIGATWQFYGDYSDQAKAGNFSQALVIGYSRDKDEESTPEELGDVNNGFNSRLWHQSTSSLDIGWVGGYRLADDWLVYGGPFTIVHDIDNTVNVEKQVDFEVIRLQNKYAFKGRQVGANIALRYEVLDWLDFHLEFVSSRYRLNNVTNSDSQFNFMVGTRF